MAKVKNKNIEKENNADVSKVDIKKETSKNSNVFFIMKTLVFIGVILACFIAIYLSYYFFVKKSNILINMSTDKKVEFINISGKEELIGTQKYVSDLKYSMRYDIEKFKVFKYRHQDIYKNIDNERILVIVEDGTVPDSCTSMTANDQYNNCYVKIDEYTDNYYITTKGLTYKITVKSSGDSNLDFGTKARIEYMINSFEVV